MTAISIDVESLPSGLKDKFAQFEVAKNTYLDSQQNFLGLDKNIKQLREDAAKLGAMALNADSACKKLAAQPDVGADELSGEITRIAGLRTQARDKQSMADSLCGSRGGYLINMARQRYQLLNEPARLNAEYYNHLMAQLFRREDVRDILCQVLSISRAIETYQNLLSTSAAYSSSDAGRREEQIKRSVCESIATRLRGYEDTNWQAPAPLVFLPPLVEGEETVRSPIELRNLQLKCA